MKLILIIFTSLSLLVLTDVGCVRRVQPSNTPSDATVAAATTSMDQGRYQEAVTALTQYLDANPNDAQVRLLLSNAYVRWAGVKFSDFIPLAKFYAAESDRKGPAPTQNAALLEALRATGGKNQVAAAHALDSFQKLFSTLSTVVFVFDIIPEVDESQYVHFSQGLAAAEAVESTKKGDALYRVLLRVIDLKFNWVHRGAFDFMDLQCRLAPEGFSNFLSQTYASYKRITTDLSIAFPSLAPTFADELASFEKVAPEVKNQLEKISGTTNRNVRLRSVWECM